MSLKEQLMHLLVEEPSVAQLFRRAYKEGPPTKEMLRGVPREVWSNPTKANVILEFLPLLYYPTALHIKSLSGRDVRAPGELPQSAQGPTSALSDTEVAPDLVWRKYSEPSRADELAISTWLQDTPSIFRLKTSWHALPTRYENGEGGSLVNVNMRWNLGPSKGAHIGSASLNFKPRSARTEIAEPEPSKRGLYLGRGERALFRVMFEDAVGDLAYKNSSYPSERSLAQIAEEWFLDDDHFFICSFINVCGFLNISPDYVRESLQKRGLLRKQHVGAGASAAA